MIGLDELTAGGGGIETTKGGAATQASFPSSLATACDFDRVSVRGRFFHEARYGHLFKNRVRESTIETSYLMDGPSGVSN
ncbi:hypothetical protein [Hydrogenophaga sp.]|uniref:hypothetical protein n=1 Tax=Hydrogenophaga sp. TaxID=1904254 RepID=UPI0025BF1EA0|nr:hypothetical protein [Hydrogenophaga sp.]